MGARVVLERRLDQPLRCREMDQELVLERSRRRPIARRRQRLQEVEAVVAVWQGRVDSPKMQTNEVLLLLLLTRGAR